MNPSDFYTRSKANEGAKLILALPDGTPTEHFLIIRSTECDAYRNKLNSLMREAARLPKEGESASVKKDESTLDLLVSLVSGWSFEKEFTEAAIREFLTESPYIADAVDRFAVKRGNFFKHAQTS